MHNCIVAMFPDDLLTLGLHRKTRYFDEFQSTSSKSALPNLIEVSYVVVGLYVESCPPLSKSCFSAPQCR